MKSAATYPAGKDAFDGRQQLAGHIAQCGFIAQRCCRAHAPAALYILAHPQAVFLTRAFHAGAHVFIRVLALARRIPFIVFKLQPNDGRKIGIERFLLQPSKQDAQALGRVRLGAPRP